MTELGIVVHTFSFLLTLLDLCVNTITSIQNVANKTMDILNFLLMIHITIHIKQHSI